MPAIRNYIVTQSRYVEVLATNSSDAARIASLAFDLGANEEFPKAGLTIDEVYGGVRSRAEVTDLNIQRT